MIVYDDGDDDDGQYSIVLMGCRMYSMCESVRKSDHRPILCEFILYDTFSSTLSTNDHIIHANHIKKSDDDDIDIDSVMSLSSSETISSSSSSSSSPPPLHLHISDLKFAMNNQQADEYITNAINAVEVLCPSPCEDVQWEMNQVGCQ